MYNPICLIYFTFEIQYNFFYGEKIVVGLQSSTTLTGFSFALGKLQTNLNFQQHFHLFTKKK